MKTFNKISRLAIVLFALVFFTPDFALAQQPEVKRTDLQRHNLSVTGYETVQARIDFEAHAAFGMHSHPGEEVIYVLEGVLEYEVEGMKSVTLKAGEVLFIPAGKFHAAKNTSNAKASELATYIVEKGKPILEMKKVTQP